MKRMIRTFVVLAAMLASTAAFANVKLLKLDAYSTSHYGIPMDHRIALVKVKNLCYEKKVTLWMEYADGSWRESANGKYVGPAEKGYEIWKIETFWSSYPQPPGPRWGDQLDVKYQVCGQTFWDNASSYDYRVLYPDDADGEMLIGNLNVLQDYANAYNSVIAGSVNFYGSIDVRNIAYQKTVRVVFTTDNWATKRTVDAHFTSSRTIPYGQTIYYPNAHDIERWDFSINLPGTVKKIQYAISYTVAGQTYWDNNFGNNYVLNIGTTSLKSSKSL